jgi:hypothetical protein
LFEVENSDLIYLTAVSWDGTIAIINCEDKTVLSNSNYKLNNDDKKHMNYGGLKLI